MIVVFLFVVVFWNLGIGIALITDLGTVFIVFSSLVSVSSLDFHRV